MNGFCLNKSKQRNKWLHWWNSWLAGSFDCPVKVSSKSKSPLLYHLVFSLCFVGLRMSNLLELEEEKTCPCWTNTSPMEMLCLSFSISFPFALSFYICPSVFLSTAGFHFMVESFKLFFWRQPCPWERWRGREGEEGDEERGVSGWQVEVSVCWQLMFRSEQEETVGAAWGFSSRSLRPGGLRFESLCCETVEAGLANGGGLLVLLCWWVSGSRSWLKRCTLARHWTSSCSRLCWRTVTVFSGLCTLVLYCALYEWANHDTVGLRVCVCLPSL